MQLSLPNKRALSYTQLSKIRATLFAEAGLMSQSHRNWRLPGRRALVVLALVGGVALLVPSIGVGRVLHVFGLGGPPQYVALENEWRDSLTSGAKSNPTESFANLPADELRSRLEAASTDFGFTVVSLDLLRPQEVAPMIVVQTDSPLRFAHAVPQILRSIDPKASGNDNEGWAYEGIFLKAIDGQGDAFLVVFNYWRDDHAGGGQWARSPELQPFDHG